MPCLKLRLCVLSLLILPAVLLGGGLFSNAHGAQVLYIADLDDANDAAGNQSIVDRLELLGHVVTTIDDDDGMTPDPEGSDLFVISSSSLSGNIGSHLTGSSKPVIQWEQALWDEMLMSNGGRGVDGQTSLEVVDIGHELAMEMGLTALGNLDIRDTPTQFHVGNTANIAPGATVIAEEAGGGAPAIAVADPGDTLNDGSPAAGTRIMVFFGDESLDGVNQIGLNIFDAAVCYALDACGAQPPDGDVNLDWIVDNVDFEIIRGNFFQSATGRTDGDLIQDGFINFADFRAWKDAEKGDFGPPPVAAAVPEPATLLIALLLAAAAAGTRRGRLSA